MTTLRQAAQQALEAMETNQYTVAELAPHKVVMKFNDAITALKAALAQPEQRKPLTDKDILADKTLRYYFGQNGGAGPVSKQGRKVVDAIEAAHGIKEGT